MLQSISIIFYSLTQHMLKIVEKNVLFSLVGSQVYILCLISNITFSVKHTNEIFLRTFLNYSLVIFTLLWNMSLCYNAFCYCLSHEWLMTLRIVSDILKFVEKYSKM